MVGGLMRLLGVFMGEKIAGSYGNKHEDAEFYKSQTKRQRARLIDRRNRDHDVWGFKDPNVCGYIGELTALRNPHFIYIVRDPETTLKSVEKRAVNWGKHAGMKRYAAHMWRAWEFCYRHIDEYPFLLMQYESVLKCPLPHVLGLADFVGVSVKPSQIDTMCDFISPGYKSLLPEKRKEWKIGT